MISGYNSPSYHIKNLIQIIARQLKLFGFLGNNPYLNEKYDKDFRQEIPKRLANGELKYNEDFTYGLKNAGQAILDVQTGRNFGKSIVVVSEE